MIAATMAAAAGGPSAAEDDAERTTILRVDESTINLGELQAGSEAVAVFVIHNDGDRDVRILRAKPS
jgi:hypothetical protein